MRLPKLVSPSSFHYSIPIALFPLLYLSVIVEAQGIIPFPSGTTISPETENIVDEKMHVLKMTGAVRARDNQIVCTGFTLPEGGSQFWIIQFSGNASTSVVHHMTLYACDVAPETNPCGCGLSRRSPLYSWVRNTPKVRFTGNGNFGKAGFRIGGTTLKQYLFLEIHYMHASTEPDQSGITIHTTSTTANVTDLAILPLMGLGTIPANTNSSFIDTCAHFPTIPSHTIVLGFQVHTHNLGRRISAYIQNRLVNQFNQIGIGNPLWPEAYVDVHSRIESTFSASNVSIYSRCEYQTVGVSSATNTNGMAKTEYQEMCIFNLLVASLGREQLNGTQAFMKGNCTAEQVAVIDNLEATISKPFLPSIPALDIAAVYGNVTGSYSYFNDDHVLNLDVETFGNAFDNF